MQDWHAGRSTRGWAPAHQGSSAHSRAARGRACPAVQGLPILLLQAVWCDEGWAAFSTTSPRGQGTHPARTSTEHTSTHRCCWHHKGWAAGAYSTCGRAPLSGHTFGRAPLPDRTWGRAPFPGRICGSPPAPSSPILGRPPWVHALRCALGAVGCLLALHPCSPGAFAPGHSSVVWSPCHKSITTCLLLGLEASLSEGPTDGGVCAPAGLLCVPQVHTHKGIRKWPMANAGASLLTSSPMHQQMGGCPHSPSRLRLRRSRLLLQWLQLRTQPHFPQLGSTHGRRVEAVMVPGCPRRGLPGCPPHPWLPGSRAPPSPRGSH